MEILWNNLKTCLEFSLFLVEWIASMKSESITGNKRKIGNVFMKRIFGIKNLFEIYFQVNTWCIKYDVMYAQLGIRNLILNTKSINKLNLLYAYRTYVNTNSIFLLYWKIGKCHQQNLLEPFSKLSLPYLMQFWMSGWVNKEKFNLCAWNKSIAIEKLQYLSLMLDEFVYYCSVFLTIYELCMRMKFPSLQNKLTQIFMLHLETGGKE